MNHLGGDLKDLPVFPQLKYLHVRGNGAKCPQEYRLLTPNVSIAFPVLETVKIELYNYPGTDIFPDPQVYYLIVFLWDETLPSVTSLKILFAVDEDEMKFLGRIFPKVTELTIDWEILCRPRGRKYCRKDLWNVWKMIPFRLHRLEIQRLNPWACDEEFSLDSFLTGIPESVCRNLRQQECAELRMEPRYFDALRGHPSMLNLKDSK